MAFPRYVTFTLIFASGVVLAAPITEEFADVNYWADRTTDPDYPSLLGERALAKQPAYVDIGTPTVSGDSLGVLPLRYAFKFDYFFRDASGTVSSNSDEFLTFPETMTADMIVDRAADLIGTGYEGATCAALVDAGYASQCQFPPLIPGENPAGSCTVTPLNGSPYGTLEDDLESCLDRVVDDARAELSGLGIPFYPAGRIYRAYCTSASRLFLDYKYASASGEDTPYGYFDFADNQCRIPVLVNAAPDQEEPEFEFEPMPDTEVTDGQLAKILYDGGAVTENFLFNPQTGKYTYFSSSGRTAESVSENYFKNLEYIAGVQESNSPSVPPDVPVNTDVQDSYSGMSRGGVSPSPTPNPTATPTPTPGDGEGQGDGNLCETNPNALACMAQGDFFDDLFSGLDNWFAGMVPSGWSEEGAFDVPTQEADGSAVSVSVASGSGCPAPRTVAVWGSVYEIDGDQMLCSALDDVSNLVRLCCSVMAAFILLGVRSGGV